MDPSYNNPFASQNSGSDIVLTSNQPQKSKKKIFVFLGIILIIVAIVAVIVFLNLPKQTNKTSRQAFNNYVNYMLFGAESDTDFVDEYMWGNTYYIQSVFDGDIDNLSDAPGIFEKLKNKYLLAYQKNTEVFEEYDPIFRYYYNVQVKDFEEAMNDEGINNLNLGYLIFPDINVDELTSKSRYYNLSVFEDIWDMKETIYEKEN